MRVILVLLGLLMAVPAAAEGEFSEGSEVTGWDGLQGREPAKFDARVVDVLCELTGDCPEDCGAGARQMGLVREADGVLVLAAKNLQTSFNGATKDLSPYCGQVVTVDGLLVGDPTVAPTKFYQVHTIQRQGVKLKARAVRWTRLWDRANPELQDLKGPWFRHDPGVKAAIEANGWLGLGEDADKVFIEENY